MEIKNEIFDARNGTWIALTEFGAEKLPFKLGWDISRIIRKMKDGYEVYEETRSKIVQELGEEKDGGYTIDPKNKEALKKYFEEIGKINSEKQEYDIKKVTVDSKEMKEVEIKPNMLVQLEDFIEVK